MAKRDRQSPLVYALAAVCAGAIAAAALVVGPPSSGQASQARTITAARGVVASTVSGSGNVRAASQLDLGFKTAGTVTHIYVGEGQHVTPGQLLAELDPQSAEVTLEKAKASLQAAEATLAQEQESGGETSAGQGAGAGAAGGEPAASAASASASASPARGAPAPSRSTTTSPTPTTRSAAGATGGSGTGAAGSSEKTRQSAATREANLASARAAVRSDALAVHSDEQAVADTKLYAPTSGTIVSLAGEVGETVVATGTSKAAASSGSGEATGSSAAGASGAGRGAGAGSSGSSGSGSSSSSSAFAVLSDLETMQLVVPLSESEIVHVRAGQPATVTVEALEGSKLAAHVVGVADLATSNSGVVSYNVTFQLDQHASGLRAGMSATAEVVVKQEAGVNVPTSAISGGTVTVVQGSRRVPRRVVTGLAGNSSTIILSGLQAGEKVALPIATSGGAGAANIVSRLGGRGGLGGLGGLGGGGLGGGGGGGGGGGAGALLRGAP